MSPFRWKRRWPRPRLERLDDRVTPSTSVARSTDVPRAIPDLGVATSTLLVPANLTIGNVSVTLNLAHPRGEDLDVFLTAPDGTRVELLADFAFPSVGSQAPFRPLTLDEAATLSVLTGRPAQGTWTLEVNDDAAGNVGTIVDWSLALTDQVFERVPNFPAAPQTIDPTTVVLGTLDLGDEDAYRLSVTSGTLSVRLTAEPGSAFRPRLRLLAPDGRELVRSDAVASLAEIVQQLDPGSYTLRVTSAGAGDQGAYRLRTEFAVTAPREVVPAVRVGARPAAVMVADLNGDAQPDLVTANKYGASVSVALGNGDGTFGTAREFDTGFLPAALAIADLDGDGWLDLVTTGGYYDGTVSVLLGRGDGSFQPERSFSVGYAPFALAVVDINGDGRLDIVTANDSGFGDVTILFGTPAIPGEVDFAAARQVAAEEAPVSLAVADVNDDDRPDLLLGRNSSDGSDVSVLLGVDGDELFAAPQRSPVADFPGSLVVADLDGDGLLDIAFAFSGPYGIYGPGAVSVLGGDGAGFFQNEQMFPVGAAPVALAAADVNGDGRLDLVTANTPNYSGDVSVLLGSLGALAFQPERRFAVGEGPSALALADVNGDGRPDVLTADEGNYSEYGSRGGDSVTVLLGNGDGSFQDRPRLGVGDDPYAVVTADLNGDGQLDLITVNADTDDISVVLGNGNGSFRQELRVAVGDSPRAVVAADVNGDGRLDLVTANYFDDSLGVLLNRGSAGEAGIAFSPPFAFEVASRPDAVAVADVNGDGRPDLVTSYFYYRGGAVSVLLGIPGGVDVDFLPPQPFELAGEPLTLAVADLNGDGRSDLIVTTLESFFSDAGSIAVLLNDSAAGELSFAAPRYFPVSTSPYDLVVADINGDGRLDLLTSGDGYDTAGLSLLLGNGAGSFQTEIRFFADTDLRARALAVADVNGDGRPDFIVASSQTSELRVILADGAPGNDTFRERRVPVGFNPNSVTVADVTNDGRLDLVTATAAGRLSVVPGNGDGTFLAPSRTPVGRQPRFGIQADLNGDGRPDLITANRGSDDVSILLGNADGSFQRQQRFSSGDENPTGVAVADLNGDGRLDLVVANQSGVGVGVLLGNGDGTFQQARPFAVSGTPTEVTIVDLDGDGLLDLVVAAGGYYSSGLSVLLGNGDGTFRPETRFLSGTESATLTVLDLNGDGQLDILAPDDSYYGGGSVRVLLGDGTGGFREAEPLDVPYGTSLLEVADLNGDGRPDLVTVSIDNDYYSGAGLSVLLSTGSGFLPPREVFLSDIPETLTLADATGDGVLDLVIAQRDRPELSVSPGNGDGTFGDPLRLPLAAEPAAVLVTDVNGDGRPDLVSVGRNTDEVTTLLGNGDATFTTASEDRTSDLRHTPQRGDVDRDGIADVVTIDNSGRILFRRGLPGGRNQFAPPIVVNPDSTARDYTLVRTRSGRVIAASNVRGDLVALYRFSAGGFRVVSTFTAGRLPQRLRAGDLNGDGRDDLIVANVLSNSVTVALQQPDGSFLAFVTTPVGVTPNDIVLADVDGRAGPDVLVVQRSSGDVTVLFNDPITPFSRSARYRAGLGLFDVQAVGASLQPASLEQPVSLVAGHFIAGDSFADLVIVQRGARQLLTLPGTGSGFGNPEARLSVPTTQDQDGSDLPGQIVSGDFDRDGILDVAVVLTDRDAVAIYRGLGDGTFTFLSSVPAGSRPTGLSVADINGDRRLDLLIGNGFGDVLFVLGDGAGAFRPFVRADQRVAFVATRNAAGGVDVFLAEQATDVARSLTSQADRFIPGAFRRDGANGLIGPSDVALADLDGVNGDDLIFANAGSNNVLVYLRQANGSFASVPLSFFAGTSPAGLHVADLNDDGAPDLAVANQGSNDVSVLLGNRGGAGQELLLLGPRLRAGQAGPTFVTSRLVDDDAVLDLITASPQSNSATLLPGVGNGLFNDAGGVTVALPAAPLDLDETFVLLADGSIVRLDFPGATTLVAAGTRAAQAFDAVTLAGFDFPVFFTANADGSVSALVSANGIDYTEALNLPLDELTSPSALAVLQGRNTVEVYVADARDGELLVLRFGPDDIPAIGLVSPGSSASLVQAATLVNSLLVENGPPSPLAGIEASVAFGLEETARDLALRDEVFVSVGERLLSGLQEEIDALADEPPTPRTTTPADVERLLNNVDEALRELGWRRQAAPPAQQADATELTRWLEKTWQRLAPLLPRLTEPSVEPPARQVPPPESDTALPLPEERAPGSAGTTRTTLQESSGDLRVWLSSAVFATWLHRRSVRRAGEKMRTGRHSAQQFHPC